MTIAGGGWAAATASVRGASHQRSGKPNQDAVRVVEVIGPTPGLVAAVCDGHGGDRYVRSDVGSRLGAEVACEVGRRALNDLGPSPTPQSIEKYLASDVANSIVAGWRDRVVQDVRLRAFSDDEQLVAGAALGGDPHVSYGSTLLLAILAPGWVGLLQIGDGDVTVVRGAHADSPVPTDDRLVGGETTSLCLPTAAADARVCALVGPLPETIVLSTDGYANSFASPTWRTEAGTDLRDQIRLIGLSGVEAQLPSWLADSATAGGDDVSMALIERVDRGVTLLENVVPAANASPLTTARTGRRGRRRAMLGLALAATALFGAGVGWAAARGGDRKPEPSSSVPVSTSPSTTSRGSVVPPIVQTTTVPISTIGPTPQPVLPGEQPLLLRGEGDGLLLVFDQSLPKTAKPQVVGWVKVAAGSVKLPRGWVFAGCQLKRSAGGPSHPAIVVAQTGNYLWAVTPDRETLTSYDLLTGKEVGRVPIRGVGDAGMTTGPPDSKCAPTTAHPDSTTSTVRADAQGTAVSGTTGQGG